MISLFEPQDNVRRNDTIFSFDDCDTTQLFEVFVDEYQQEQENLDDEDAEFASECKAIFGE